MCTQFSCAMDVDWGKVAYEKQQRRLESARSHLDLCLEVYQMQRDGGRSFIHDPPPTVCYTLARARGNTVGINERKHQNKITFVPIRDDSNGPWRGSNRIETNWFFDKRSLPSRPSSECVTVCQRVRTMCERVCGPTHSLCISPAAVTTND